MTRQYLEQIAHAMKSTAEPEVQRELIDHAHETMHELALEWRGPDNLGPEQDSRELIDLLVSLRTQLRSVKQFALADRVRDELARAGILLEDTPTGTRWSKNK